MTDSPLYVIVHEREDGAVEVESFPNPDLVFTKRAATELGDTYRVAELRYTDEEG